MRKKIFTPLNVGLFHLQHRLVVDWGRISDSSDKRLRKMSSLLREPLLEGGLVIVDPALIMLESQGDPLEVARLKFEGIWPHVLEDVKTGRHYVLARLGSNLATPSAVTSGNVEQIINVYVDAAMRARSNGFDGVEVDAAIGSGIDLLLRPHTAARSVWLETGVAEWTGFMMELIEALVSVIGRERVGVRMSTFQSRDGHEYGGDVGERVVRRLNEHELAYVHLVSTDLPNRLVAGLLHLSPEAKSLRQAYPGILISGELRSLGLAIELVESRWADAISFSGREFDGGLLENLRLAWSGNAGA